MRLLGPDTCTSRVRSKSWMASGRSEATPGGYPRLQRLTNHRALRRARLVEPADRRLVRRVAGDLRILGAFAQDLGDGFRERVERLLGLGLGRLDQQRLVDDQREVDRRRVEREVEQALGEIERAQAELLLHRRAREDELVHAQAVVR